MAGIKANSASVTMEDGDTATAKVQSGYVTGEQITLTTTGSPSTYSWSLSIPSASTAAKSALDTTTGSAPKFRPDVSGEYVVVVTVDSSTEYRINMQVTAATAVDLTGALHFSPRTDASVATPNNGATLYYSSDQSALAFKDAAGDVYTLDNTAA